MTDGVNAESMAGRHGGPWGEHPAQPVKDWQYQVANGDTRLGYWDWVIAQVNGEPEAIAESLSAVGDGGIID